ncbi:MAG: DUF11 domain-containing protein, partial [Dehalococcoidia bacterium]|nr:DUF11 domain-containing protein [Dehalococcoidia bacterium]
MRKGDAARMLKRSLILALFGVVVVGGSLFAQGITGPSEMALCDQATFTITVTNDSATQRACNIVITNTMPNADFSYVDDSSVVCLPSPGCTTCARSGNQADPTIAGNNLVWNIDNLCGGSIELGPGESLAIDFDMATNCDT